MTHFQKRWWPVAIAAVSLGCFLYFRPAPTSQPRSESLRTAAKLEAALHSNNDEELVNLLIFPASFDQRTNAEKAEFARKALRDEISKEGLALLQAKGEFGPLLKIFPAESTVWAGAAGVRPEDCVAFRLSQSDGRADLVLATNGLLYRIIRVNNLRAATTE